jgi:cytochrome c oxidase assembly protein subunit 17
MPFGWFSGSSTPSPEKKVETSATLKSTLPLTEVCFVDDETDPLNPEGIKPCCACPITKQKRDDCFMNSANGEVECSDLIQAHKE